MNDIELWGECEGSLGMGPEALAGPTEASLGSKCGQHLMDIWIGQHSGTGGIRSDVVALGLGCLIDCVGRASGWVQLVLRVRDRRQE